MIHLCKYITTAQSEIQIGLSFCSKKSFSMLSQNHSTNCQPDNLRLLSLVVGKQSY